MFSSDAMSNYVDPYQQYLSTLYLSVEEEAQLVNLSKDLAIEASLISSVNKSQNDNQPEDTIKVESIDNSREASKHTSSDVHPTVEPFPTDRIRAIPAIRISKPISRGNSQICVDDQAEP